MYTNANENPIDFPNIESLCEHAQKKLSDKNKKHKNKKSNLIPFWPLWASCVCELCERHLNLEKKKKS